jgi:hypothetical protein
LGRRAVLQQARHGRAMDQGRQAGGALDAVVMSPLPGKRGSAATERPGLQPRESLAAAGATGAGRHLVADQPPAAPRQDGRTASQARLLLLAPAGRESSDTAAVRVDAPADLGAARAGRWPQETVWAKRGRNTGEVSEKYGRSACSSVGIQVALAGHEVPSKRQEYFAREKSERRRMSPIMRSQIGNVG